GRRTQCINNLKQLALGCQNFHDINKKFPVGIQFASGQNPANSNDYMANWVISILPFMEQHQLYEAFNLGTATAPVYISDPQNRIARGQVLPTMICPTDAAMHVNKFAGVAGGTGTMTSEGDNWA